MTVCCVLRSGGDFRPTHVYALKRALNEHLPDHDFRCLTDVESLPPHWRIPLSHDWPGWWAKMLVCEPGAVAGPLLFIDLDMVIVGGLSPLIEDTSRSICLRDLYRGRRNKRALQSALMLLTEADRALVWETFTADRKRWMKKRSDQDVYEAVLAHRVAYFQDTHPGMVVGYKTDLERGKKAPGPDARIVAFHGRPRPWDCGQPWAEAPFRAVA